MIIYGLEIIYIYHICMKKILYDVLLHISLQLEFRNYIMLVALIWPWLEYLHHSPSKQCLLQTSYETSSS